MSTRGSIVLSFSLFRVDSMTRLDLDDCCDSALIDNFARGALLEILELFMFEVCFLVTRIGILGL